MVRLRWIDVRILALSDTHIPDFARALPPALQRPLTRADLILHAGDVTSGEILDELASFAPLHVALGNNDRPSVAAWGALDEVHLDLDGIRMAMVHDAGPREGRDRRLRRRFPETDLVVFGHSHIPLDDHLGAMRLFNPGSPTWKRRQPKPTFGWIEVVAGRVRTRIVEL